MTRVVSGDILLFHFDKQSISTALVILIAGYGIGTIIAPILSQYLFDSVGFAVAMLVMGSISSIPVIAGISYTETEDYPKPSMSGSEGESETLVKSRLQDSLTAQLGKLVQNVRVSVAPGHHFYSVANLNQVKPIRLCLNLDYSYDYRLDLVTIDVKRR